MSKINLSSVNPSDGTTTLEITISGESSETSDLIVGAIETLISRIDIKNLYDGDYDKYGVDFERILLALGDLKGYEFYYSLPEFEKEVSYDWDNDVTTVPRDTKLRVLERVVQDIQNIG